jgi:hypothetical protein
VDLQPAMARTAARQSFTTWADALQALVDHQPVTTWRGNTCESCGTSWPCAVREGALDELAGAR